MKRLLAAIALLLAPASLLAAPTMYRYDTVHSQVLFSVGHNHYSRPVGRLHIAAGWLRFDPDDLGHAATALDIDLTSLDMGDPDWNKAVRGHRFLDTAHARLAHFRSTSVTPTGPQRGVLHGMLTLRGITLPVDVVFTVNRVGFTLFGMHRVAGFSGRASVNRDAFGMRSFQGSVGHVVTIRLEVEAVADAAAQTHYQAQHPHRADHATQK